MKPELQATRWFAEGVKEHKRFQRAFTEVREAAINAGFFFLSARQCVANGDWTLFCEVHGQDVSTRTVRFYIQLAEAAIEWVRAEQPKLKKISEIQSAARAMILQSPKPLVALCRELGHMRKFGEYDAVKYAAHKRLGNGAGQIEFDFEKLSSTVDVLAHLDKYELRFPEGMEQIPALQDFKAKLLTAVDQVESQIKQWEAVPI